MKDNIFLDLNPLSEKELEFYNFTIANYEMTVNSTVKEIAQLYGVGISFIYNFFKKLNVSGIREYAYKLGMIDGFRCCNNLSQEKLNNNLLASLSKNYKISDALNAELLNLQKEETNWLVSCLIKKYHSKKIIYGFGLGHSAIVIKDLFGSLSKYGFDCLQIGKKDKILKSVHTILAKDSVLLIYTMRGLHPYTTKLIKNIALNRPDVTMVCITSNTASKIARLCSSIIYVDNCMKRAEYDNDNLVLSPMRSFIYFNDYLKNMLIKAEKEFSSNQLFKKELWSWHGNKTTYN